MPHASRIRTPAPGGPVAPLLRNDALSEIATLLKSGRVRVHLNPNPFRKGQPLRQEQKLRDGRCEIAAGPKEASVRLTFLVDADAQDIRLRVQSDKPVSAQLAFFNWRSDRRDSHNDIGNAVYPMRGAPKDVDACPIGTMPTCVPGKFGRSELTMSS
jgi:hypothetical protein